MIRLGWTALSVSAAALMLFGSFDARAESPDGPIEGCPQGATLKGEAPPRGRAQWCEAADLFGVVKKSGPFRTWHRNGRLRTDGAFVDGKRHGIWSAYNERGKLTAEQTYHFDRLIQERTERASYVSEREAAPVARTAPSAAAAEPVTPQPHKISGPSRETDFREYLDRSERSGVEAYASTELTVSSQADLGLYSTIFETGVAFGAVHVWGQWGLSFVDAPGETFIEPLNPALFAGYVLEFSPAVLRFGAGASIPVHRIPENGTLSPSQVSSLAAVAAAAPPRGLYNFWLYLPEFPVVAIPMEVDLQLPALLGRAELVPYFAIPTRSGASTDLNLQAAVEAGYPILDILSVGMRAQLVAVALTNDAQVAFGIEPNARFRYGAFFVRAGVLLNVVEPDAFSLGDGLGWGVNLRLGVTL